jgi:threonine dehydratase
VACKLALMFEFHVHQQQHAVPAASSGTYIQGGSPAAPLLQCHTCIVMPSTAWL